MGSNQQKSNKKEILIDNFGKKEKIELEMNIFLITEINSQNLFKKLIGMTNNEENIEINRERPIEHKSYSKLKFTYLQKEENELIEHLLDVSFEKIKLEREETFTNKDVFIIRLARYDEFTIKNYIKIFIEQEFDEEHQPFILFLTDENDINGKQENIRNLINIISQEYIKEKYANNEEEKNKKLNNLLPEEYYLPYNIFLTQFRDNEENERNDITEINNYLLKFASCYNEIGDLFTFIKNNNNNNNISYNFVNILCVGRTCTGKSTFINTFFNERKCNVGGNGMSKTKRINFYSDFSKQIRIYDTIGFEGEESTSKIIKLLQRLNVELINCKQKIHLILYFIQGKINFEEHEYKVFNEIIKYKSHIIFIKTHSKNNLPETYQREKNRLYENIRDLFKRNEQNLIKNKVSNKEIEKIKELYANYLLNYDKFENLILMNLRKDEDDSKIFGMDNLYKAIYNYLKHHIIRIQDINNIEFDNNQNNPNNNNNINPIYFIIKDNLFLKKYRTIKDIFESLQWDKKLIIAKNAFYAGLSGINPIPLIDIGTYYLIEKNLKTELARLYQFDIDKNVFLNEKYNKNEIEKNKEINNKIENSELGLVIINNSTKIFASGISLINDLKNITNIKIIIDGFVNVCRSSLILYFVGNVIGGAFNVGLIIYEGNLFANFFENELRKDQGVNYLINAAKSYNKAIKSFKDLAQIEDDVEIIID